MVCQLHEGDDFGKLALVNDAPRAASIILRLVTNTQRSLGWVDDPKWGLSCGRGFSALSKKGS